MASEVKTSYSAEQVEILKAAVAEGQSVEQMATTLGKSVRSVIAKLSQLGLYKSEKVTKASTRVTKSALVAAIAVKLDLTVETLASLEKADKSALSALATALEA